jgi:acetylornithine deacetylase/succinyl-diaminopimelate desuccinylase-like protein
MSASTNAMVYAQQQRERFLQELQEFVAIPSISTLPEYQGDMRRAAEWVAANMRAGGLENVAIMPTGGHPVVYGEWLHAPGKPTVLVYGHYDVQPADPLDEWITPPFTATIRDNNLYGRGTSDTKGNIHEVLKALEALRRTDSLPLNVKVLIEGEEEIGSKHLGTFIDQHAEMLKCDLCLNTDSSILGAEQPSLVIGLRGLAYFELWVYGPAQDLHSGLFGGSIHNPAQALCELIAGMHDENGRVTLPGFYDKVRTLTPQERADYAALPMDDEQWKAMAGVSELWGEKGFTTQERVGARPTLEINGLLSGFTGEGSKTVLPAKAMAKISMRLVPYQDHTEVEAQLKAYLAAHAPPTIRWEVKSTTGSAPGVLLDRDSIGARAARAALRDTFGKEPIFVAEGGSIPIVTMLREKLGADTVLLGFSLPDDRIHGPNERLYLPNYFRGIESFMRFFENLARAQEASV